MKVADFFNMEQAQENVKKTQPTTTSIVDADIKAKSTDEKTTTPADSSQMTLNLKIEKPDIILVEHMDNINTNAMIVNVSTVYSKC